MQAYPEGGVQNNKSWVSDGKLEQVPAHPVSY